MPPSSRRNLALQDAPTKRYDRKAMLSAPPFSPAAESEDDFSPTLSGGRGYERFIGRERVASVVSRHEDVLATRQLPRIDATLLRASLPSSPDLDDLATNERPRAQAEPKRLLRALPPLESFVASVGPSDVPPHARTSRASERRSPVLLESFDPREAETAERPQAVLVSAEPPTTRALVDDGGSATPADEPSFPIEVEIDEPSSATPMLASSVALAIVKPEAKGVGDVAARAVAKPGKNKLRRALSASATVVGLAAIVACAVLALRSPEAKVRFPAGVSVASEAVVRFARSAVDVAVRGVRRIHANVEVPS